MKVEIELKRIARRETYSIGRLSIDEQYICDTIEDRDRGLTSSMPPGEISGIKVYGQTAIPTGRYRVVLSQSAKFSNKSWARKYDGLVPELKNVKGFVGTRIHPANTAEELRGCIAPGTNTTVGRVNNSVAAYCRIMSILKPAWDAASDIYITIQ